MNKNLRHGIQLAVLFAGICAASTSAQEVRVEKDVPYLPGDRAEKLDLYLPADAGKGERHPAIVIIHGGGWAGGKKDAARERNIGNTLAAHGYVCASIDYALASEGKPTWPGNLHDCKRAVRFLRKNAARYRIDPDHIGVIGGSAGGHLTAMVALTGPDAGLDPGEPDADISCRVQAAVPMYPPVTLRKDTRMLPGTRAEVPELYRKASPLAHITPDDPPMLILHGTADKTVPVEESHILADALKEAGVPHELVIIEGAPHTFHLQPKQRDLRPLVLGFFDRHLKPGPFRDFLKLCDLACRELNTETRKAVPFYNDSYAVRALCVAYDMTGNRRYLEVCKAWSDRMIGFQEKMTPAGAYYMNYNRAPGKQTGAWYVADSSSIALGVLATAIRCEDASEKARYLNSAKAFAKLVMDNYVSPDGGIRNGLWPQYDGPWWCSSGIFGSLALMLHDVTGDEAYLKTGLGALDWLNRHKLNEHEEYPLDQMGPTLPMYVLETHSTAMPRAMRDSRRRDPTLALWREALVWITAHQASRGNNPKYSYDSQWGTKFGGLPFHMYVYARHVPGSEDVRQAADRELEYVAGELAKGPSPAAKAKPHGPLTQLAVFAMLSYAERLSPGAIYRAGGSDRAVPTAPSDAKP